MMRKYQKNFGKPKSAMEHQKWHGQLSECVVLTIQTVNSSFYVEIRDWWEIRNCNIHRRQTFKRTEIINTCRHKVGTNLPTVKL